MDPWLAHDALRFWAHAAALLAVAVAVAWPWREQLIRAGLRLMGADSDED